MAKIIDTEGLKTFLQRLSRKQLSAPIFVVYVNSINSDNALTLSSDGTSFTVSGDITIDGSNQYIGVGSSFGVTLAEGTSLSLKGLAVVQKSASISNIEVTLQKRTDSLIRLPETILTNTSLSETSTCIVYVGANGMCYII